MVKHLGAPTAGLALSDAILVGEYHLLLNGEAYEDSYFRRGDSGFIIHMCAEPLCVVIVAEHDARRDMQAGPCRAACRTRAS